MAAARKKKSKTQLSFKMGINDERIPKLGGVVCLFLALILFIAFTSYIFTWKADQNHVMKFSWELLIHREVAMSNWLGRLGAILSHQFFYWWFGLPSYLIVFLLGISGVALIQRTPFSRLWKVFRYAFWLMLFSSVFLAFCFSTSEFPWGGTFGSSVSGWLTNFLGTSGMFVFFVAVIIGFFIWVFNPNFNEFSYKKFSSDFYTYWNNLVNGRKKKPKPSAPIPLKPKGITKPVQEEKDFEFSDEHLPQGEQLEFDLVDKNNYTPTNKESLKKGEGELEINVPSASESENNLSVTVENQSHSEPYDPTLDLSHYEHPVLQLLNDYDNTEIDIDRAELQANKDQIIETLLNYKIEIVKIKATIGPTVTLYEIVPAPGVRISKIKNLEDDIALSLAALGIRIIAPIPGKGTIGIEVPNKKPRIVSLKEVLMSDKFRNAKMDLPIALGKTISNEVFIADLAKMPHLLMAGATGQGKSVGINTILCSLLYKKHPSQIKLVLIDPKKVELFPYSKLDNHFLAFLPGEDEPITTETNKVVHTLNSLCIEMDQRYNLLKNAHVRNIREYNEKFVKRSLNPLNGHRFLPFIILVIDEFADLIMTAGKEIELPIGRLAQLARAVGIHLIIATQRPSVNIITGVIKANFPARIAYKVSSKIDSRTILDGGGADQLIGRGDMLLSVGADVIRLQCAFVDTPEVESVIDFISNQQGYPTPFYLPEFHGDDEVHGATGIKISELDENFEDAARLVVQNQSGSTSMIQRKLRLGYNRAGRIMDQMEALGIVGPSEGSKAREVLIYDEIELMKYLDKLKNKN